MQKVVFFAVSDFDEYKAGDLIPSAYNWPARNMYVEDGRIAPALVALLPDTVQESLREWERKTGNGDGEGEVIGEVVNEHERAEKARKAEEQAKAKAAREQAQAEEAAREQRDAEKAQAQADEQAKNTETLDDLTKEALVDRINSQGFIEAHISSNKPELIKQAQHSDALVEKRYDDVTREVLDGEVARRNDGRDEADQLDVPSDATKDDVVALLQADDEDADSDES